MSAKKAIRTLLVVFPKYHRLLLLCFGHQLHNLVFSLRKVKFFFWDHKENAEESTTVGDSKYHGGGAGGHGGGGGGGGGGSGGHGGYCHHCCGHYYKGRCSYCCPSGAEKTKQQPHN
ncbi:hypothetical protein Syun_009778 [Stephania yunnanensis]|uniref:Glycine-rich protein n=1 Tax=Stephania yunnanensis TaxID=152371 RepID=A0AAP0KHC1_9MAGN